MGRRPFSGQITDYWGWRERHPVTGLRSFHYGVDGIGGPNLMPEDGVLISHGWAGGWGIMSTVQGASGYLHRLAHSATITPLIPVGSWAPEGAPVAVQGMTGTADGVHCHWEVLDSRGTRIDPLAWFGAQPAGRNMTPIKKTPKEETLMLLRTKQHGYYTVAPGAVICHPTTKVIDGIGFRDWATIMDIAPDDLPEFIFALSGCPAESIPAPGKTWMAR
jgi:hypothetical protein